MCSFASLSKSRNISLTNPKCALVFTTKDNNIIPHSEQPSYGGWKAVVRMIIHVYMEIASLLAALDVFMITKGSICIAKNGSYLRVEADTICNKQEQCIIFECILISGLRLMLKQRVRS